MLQRKDRRDEIAEVWLRAAGFSPVVAMATRDDARRIMPFFGEAGGVIKLVARRIESDHLVLVTEIWFENSRIAQRVYDKAFGQIPAFSGWVNISAEDGNRMVLAAATALSVSIRSDVDTAAMAIAAADHLIQSTEQQRVSGELRELNKAYRAYRLAFDEAGRADKPVDYQDWLHKYRLLAAGAAGTKIRQTLRFST